MAAAYCYERIPLRFLASLFDIQMRYLVYMRYLWLSHFYTTKFSLTNLMCQFFLLCKMFFHFMINLSKIPNLEGQKKHLTHAPFQRKLGRRRVSGFTLLFIYTWAWRN